MRITQFLPGSGDTLEIRKPPGEKSHRPKMRAADMVRAMFSLFLSLVFLLSSMPVALAAPAQNRATTHAKSGAHSKPRPDVPIANDVPVRTGPHELKPVNTKRVIPDNPSDLDITT